MHFDTFYYGNRRLGLKASLVVTLMSLLAMFYVSDEAHAQHLTALDSPSFYSVLSEIIESHGIVAPVPEIPEWAESGPWVISETTDQTAVAEVAELRLWAKVSIFVLYIIIGLICVYTVRHYLFTFNRLFGKQLHPYLPVDAAEWPQITILIPCHNEEAVIDNILDALVHVDYPTTKLSIVPVNDRSTDRTEVIIDEWVTRFPNRIRPFHRSVGFPGKAAALKDAIPYVDGDIMLVFDADYIPGVDLIKRLVAPFLDPEIGAVMGRVVPLNTSTNLLTRLLDLERSAGYQVDQQARMNLGLIPQYGGTVGGIRVSALSEVGGWREDSLTEDTDLTCRLVLGGWKIAYSNRYECYEEVPETWPSRINQIKRWARGHTDAAVRYIPDFITNRGLSMRVRIDGVLLLGTYLMAPTLFAGWLIAIALFFAGAQPFYGVWALLAVASYNTIGNFACFFQIGAAVKLDHTSGRIRLLPFVLGGFIVSLVSTSTAVVSQLLPSRTSFKWDKTERFRVAGDRVPVSHATLRQSNTHRSSHATNRQSVGKNEKEL
jgi:cellulose synthase/poly-beta-1,6-N-acetylglucosamine synthase-like glycosyltransferase